MLSVGSFRSVFDMRDGWTHAVAGSFAGLASVSVSHPLEVIKLRLQVQDGTHNINQKYTGTLDAFSKVLRTEGARGLYAGMAPALLGSTISWAVYFYSYNNAKQRYQQLWPNPELQAPLNLLSGFEAGALGTLVTNPIWVLKTRLALQRVESAAECPAIVVPEKAGSTASHVPPSRPRYNGIIDATRKIAVEEGFGAFYRGVVPSLLLITHGALQFMIYEDLKQRLAPPSVLAVSDFKHTAVPAQQPGLLQVGMAGLLSKAAASFLTYPWQVMRTRQQQWLHLGDDAHTYSSTTSTFRHIIRHEGLHGLYKGFIPNILKVLPTSAVTFIVYESVNSMLT